MLYKYTKDNIVRLLHSVGVLELDQITQFFSDQLTKIKTEELVENLCSYHVLQKDSQREDLIRYHSGKIPNREVEKRKIEAFWVIASMGSKNVLEVIDMTYPTQYMFWDPDNHIYDITIVRELSDASLSARIRQVKQMKDMTDDVRHIALCTDLTLGTGLRHFGFNYLCTVDPKTHKVETMKLE